MVSRTGMVSKAVSCATRGSCPEAATSTIAVSGTRGAIDMAKAGAVSATLSHTTINPRERCILINVPSGY